MHMVTPIRYGGELHCLHYYSDARVTGPSKVVIPRQFMEDFEGHLYHIMGLPVAPSGTFMLERKLEVVAVLEFKGNLVTIGRKYATRTKNGPRKGN